jgi:NAD(P)-dependent dehydrogenase (short-subunit alcohol dehydrogenase family)
MAERRWLVTGCSSGLGWALAHHLAAAGEPVLATARDITTLTGLRDHGSHVAVSTLDVRNPRHCADAVSLAVERFGGVDVLVNNAGYGQFGVVEEVSDAELAAQFDTNLYGPWRLVREILPLWREQAGGHAIFSSSLSGSMAFPGLSAYTASKFALEGLAEALAAEAGQFGVKVTILQLGGFATSYGDKLRAPAHPIGAYEPVVAGMLAALRALGGEDSQLSPPSLFAEVVSRLAGLSDPPFRLPLGTSAVEYLDAVLTSRRAQLDQAKAGLVDQLPDPA